MVAPDMKMLIHFFYGQLELRAKGATRDLINVIKLNPQGGPGRLKAGILETAN